MKIIRQKKDLEEVIKNISSISFVPTMGSLHKGHEFLINKARKKNKIVLVSIFVNPKQFNSKSDFRNYPRNFKKDLKICKKLKVNYLYYPFYKDIYGFKTKNKIYIHPFAKKLCGKTRPGHFKGVLEVVNRFLELIKPKYIFLGKKDFQQLLLIKKHILKNNIKTKIFSCKTLRYKRYLPYSSRNYNLNISDLNLALKAFKIIKKEKEIIKKYKFKKFNFFKTKKKLQFLGIKNIDYIEAINLKTLQKPKKYNENFNIFSAFYVNKIRLIDNL